MGPRAGRAPIQRADKERVCGAEPGGSESRGPRGAPRPPTQHSAESWPAAPAWPSISRRHPLQMSRATASKGRPRLPSPFQLPFLPLSPAAACTHPSRQRREPAGGWEESGERQPPRSTPSSSPPDKRLSTPAAPLNALISPTKLSAGKGHAGHKTATSGLSNTGVSTLPGPPHGIGWDRVEGCLGWVGGASPVHPSL